MDKFINESYLSNQYYVCMSYFITIYCLNGFNWFTLIVENKRCFTPVLLKQTKV